MRSSLLANSETNSISPLENVPALLQAVSSIRGLMVTHIFVWWSDKVVSCLTAGRLADLSVCPGEDLGSGEVLDMFCLGMTPTRDTKEEVEIAKSRTDVSH